MIWNNLSLTDNESLLNCSAGTQLAIDAAQLNVDTLCGGFAQESFKYLNYTDIKRENLSQGVYLGSPFGTSTPGYSR